MVDVWIPITILAALVQNARSVGQRWLLGRASVAASAYARFFYGFPFALAFLTAATILSDQPLYRPTFTFLAFAAIGALGQVLGNSLFIKAVRASNFTVMTTYSKMETVLSPILSFFLMNDRLSVSGAIGIVIAIMGVMWLAAVRAPGGLAAFLTAFIRPPASQGIAVGALYAVASTLYRAATHQVGDVGFVLQAATLLAWVATFQTLMMGGYLLWRMPPVITEVLRGWRHLAWIGASGAISSACWLSAFSLQKTGYVLAVGQIELVFAYIASHLLFKERTHVRELVGIAVTVTGILTVVIAR